MKSDQKFYNTFSIIIGALALVELVFFIVSMEVSSATGDIYTSSASEYQGAVSERLKPFGEVYLSGDAIAADEPQVAEARQAEPVATTLSGPQVYNAACIACHGSGVGGAPMLADASNWQPRIAQGVETLHNHAISGYQGQAGYMPPKGGRLDLSDKEIYDAIDYMLSQVPQ